MNLPPETSQEEDESSADWSPPPQDSGRMWGKAKRSILKLLWPGYWVPGSVIFDAIQQTEYDRRIRELKESGWDIVTSPSNKEYRLRSHVKAPGNKRQYPSKALKKSVFDRDNGTCQICRNTDMIQYDHKTPWERGGANVLENLQLLCRSCNIEKRGVCKSCELDCCDECPYAYPELFSGRLTLVLDPETIERLKEEARERGIPPNILAGSFIKERY